MRKTVSDILMVQRMRQQIEARLETVMTQISNHISVCTGIKFLTIAGCAVFQIIIFGRFFHRKLTAV